VQLGVFEKRVERTGHAGDETGPAVEEVALADVLAQLMKLIRYRPVRLESG